MVAGDTAGTMADIILALRARCEGAERKLAAAEAELREERAVCVCGCPPYEHESYGEDGESCGSEDHDCLLVSLSAGVLFWGMQAKLVEGHAAALKDAATQREVAAILDASRPPAPGEE